MRSRFRLACGVAACLAVVTPSLPADQTSGTSSFAFLNIPVGARSTAMGQAFTSVPNDVQGLPYNPAGLATMIASQISFQHLSYVEDTVQEAVLLGQAGRDKTLSWGLSANYLRVGQITRTVATGLDTGEGFSETGDLSTYDLSLGLSGAGPVADDLQVGGTVKFIRESLADASSNAGAVDAGIMYQLQDEHAWNLGASLLNLGFASRFSEASVKLPWTFRAGISGQPFAQWLLALDYVKRMDMEGEIDAGIEVNPRRFFSFRLGYRYAFSRPDLGGLSDFSAGVGLRQKQLSLDYAFIPLGDLGTTHRVTIGWRFKARLD